MGFYINKEGNAQQVTLPVTLYQEAIDKNLHVSHLINQTYQDVDPAKGSAFSQLCASEGLSLVGDNPFGLRSASVHDILEGKAGFSAGPANTRDRSTEAGGTQSRILFPAAVIELVEDMFYDSKKSDDVVFRDMVKTTISIAGDFYRQPVLSYQTPGGPNSGVNGAKAARVTQLGELPNILKITTSDRQYNIPAYGIGIEMSQEAMKGTTLDMFGLTVKRYIDIEHNARVNTYLSNLFLGDADQNTGAVPAVTSASLDTAATGGVMTHRAWVKFLARNRRRRKITHIMCDLDMYLKIESRTGRPGSHSYDPRLAVLDPQLIAREGSVGFGNNVQWLITDAAAEGGPVPANTVWALDKEQAIKLVTNTEADYKATEEFVLRRSSVMAWTWAEEALRLFGDSDMIGFDVMTLS